MKNINFNLGKNATNEFANLVNAAAARTLETVTFISKKGDAVTEETRRVSYEFKESAAVRESMKHGVKFHAVVSNVGGGEQSYYICEMKNSKGQILTAFDNIVNIRKKFGISYKIEKADKFEDVLRAVRNYSKSFDIEMNESDDPQNDTLHVSFRGIRASDKKRLEKIESKTAIQKKIDEAVLLATISQYELMIKCGANIEMLRTMPNFDAKAFEMALANVAKA